MRYKTNHNKKYGKHENYLNLNKFLAFGIIFLKTSIGEEINNTLYRLFGF